MPSIGEKRSSAGAGPGYGESRAPGRRVHAALAGPCWTRAGRCRVDATYCTSAEALGLVEVVLGDDDRGQQHRAFGRLGLVLGVGAPRCGPRCALLAGELLDRAGELAVAHGGKRFRQRVEAVEC